ncbi:hypothetical protein MNBD_NITROSPINAE02-1615, partial [hydrothermal vent metagenome]
MSNSKHPGDFWKTKFTASFTVATTAMIYSVVNFFSQDPSGGEHTAPYVFATYVFIFIATPSTLYVIHLYRTRHPVDAGYSDDNADQGREGGGVAVWIFVALMVAFGAGAVTMGWHGIESRKVKAFCERSVGIGAKIEDVEARARANGFAPSIYVGDVPDESVPDESVPDRSSGRLIVMKTVSSVHFICGVYYEHGLAVKKSFYTQ